MLIRFKFIALLLVQVLFSISVMAQRIEVIDSVGNSIAFFEGDYLQESGEDKIGFTIKGNLIFKGNSNEQKDILLMVKTDNIFNKKRAGEIFSSNMKTVRFWANKGRFFTNTKAGTFGALIAYFDFDSSGDLLLRNGTTQEVLAKVKQENLSTGQLTALFYLMNINLKLEELAIKQLAVKSDTIVEYNPRTATVKGSIKRLWNTGSDEFIWDGYVLKRKWNSFDFEEWTFDGTSLRRVWYSENEEFVWDGNTMKRRWYNSADEFEWDGRILKRRFGSINSEFIVQGNVVKKYFGNDEKHEWQIDGEIPIPVIALVIFNLLRK